MMNFSRSIYLKTLCDGILRLSDKQLRDGAKQLLDEINHEAAEVLNRQIGGFWPLAASESIFLKYLEELRRLIEQGSKQGEIKRDIKDLQARAAMESEPRIKIVFFTQETTCWPSLESIYDACRNDKRFLTDLVYIPFEHANANHATDHFKIYKEELGLPVISHDQYRLSEEAPDIAVFVKPYDCIPMQFYIDDVIKVVPRCVYIRYGFEIAAWNLTYHFKLSLHDKAWKFIVYGDKVKELAALHGNTGGKNVVAWGHPRADYYRNLEECREAIPEEWRRKIGGRKVVLWNTQHTVRHMEGAGTFFQWKDEVFSYFDNNTDMVLLWRPHPLMFGALVNYGTITKEELDELVRTVESKDNVILDRSADYRNSFYASDAIITDGTAFLIEYFYTKRPLIYTPKDNDIGDIYFRDEICENVYVARNKGDIIKLLDTVKRGCDPMREKRLSFGKHLLKINQQGNGEYIKEQIYSELIGECKVEI